MTTSIRKQKAIAIEYAMDLGFKEASVYIPWHVSKRFVDPTLDYGQYGRVTKMVVADKIATTPVQARVIKRGGMIVNQTAKIALNQV